MTNVLIKKGDLDADTQGECHVKIKANIRAMQPNPRNAEIVRKSLEA